MSDASHFIPPLAPVRLGRFSALRQMVLAFLGAGDPPRPRLHGPRDAGADSEGTIIVPRSVLRSARRPTRISATRPDAISAVLGPLSGAVLLQVEDTAGAMQTLLLHVPPFDLPRSGAPAAVIVDPALPDPIVFTETNRARFLAFLIAYMRARFPSARRLNARPAPLPPHG